MVRRRSPGEGGSKEFDRREQVKSVTRIEAAEAAVSPAAGIVLAVTVVVLVATAATRVVPESERLVVSRWGRAVRVVGPGLVLRVPGVERWRPVSLAPFHLRMDIVAVASDGVPVHVQVAATCRVTDPGRSLLAHPDAYVESQAVIESHVAREVARVEVTQLLGLRLGLESTLPAELAATTSRFGVEVEDLTISDIEVRLTMSLLESLRQPTRTESRR
jgi:regulator of protease activity HflC (stomatin/prohibitin superfamily)